jgi:hypothetical protein
MRLSFPPSASGAGARLLCSCLAARSLLGFISRCKQKLPVCLGLLSLLSFYRWFSVFSFSGQSAPVSIFSSCPLWIFSAKRLPMESLGRARVSSSWIFAPVSVLAARSAPHRHFFSADRDLIIDSLRSVLASWSAR